MTKRTDCFLFSSLESIAHTREKRKRSQPLLQHVVQLVQVEGFCDVIVHARIAGEDDILGIIFFIPLTAVVS